MVNPQLLQYVRAQRTAGISKEDIIKALAGGGWSASDAQEAFAAIDGPPPAPLAPKPPAPPPVQTSAPAAMSAMSPAVQPRPVNTMTSTMQQPMSVRSQPVAVVQQRPVYAPQVKRRSRWPWVLLGLTIFFILGMGAGAYLAVTNTWINSTVMTLAGAEAPQEEPINMVSNEGDTGGFLEVSPDPFDTLPTEEENSTSTPGTATSTSSTATSSSSGL